MNYPIDLISQRLKEPGTYNVQINRCEDGRYYVFSNSQFGGIKEAWNEDLKAAICAALEEDLLR